MAGWAAVALGALRLSRGPGRWVWLLVAALNLGFAIETAYPLRGALTDWLREAVRAVGGVEAIRNRRALQVTLIAVLLVPLSFLAVRVVRSRVLSRPAKMGLLAAGTGLTGLVLETISWHHLDQHSFIYWAFRYTGLGLGIGAVAWALVSGRPASPSRSHPESS